jgi:serine/threonine protein kinase
MDHAHIAKVYDGGTTDGGRPYFVMELVKGKAITDYCDLHRLPTRQRLEIFLDICHAVQHAHQKGIIHRDLKPSNVLVSHYDVRAVVKVIDFGVAKATGERLTDQSFYTGVAQMIGTPLYMSPEQAGLSDLDVDTLIYMDKLACGYGNVGRVAEAVPLLEETFKLYQAKLAPDHPDRLATMSNLGRAYSDVGRWAEAAALYRETLELKKVALGADHPETLITLNNLGTVYRDSGRPAEAVPLLEEAVRLHTLKLGPDHYTTMIFSGNLATVYRDTGRLNEARTLFEETLRRQMAKLSADHPSRLLVLNHTGACLLKMKKYDEADVLLRDCLALRTRKAPGEWWVSHTKSHLGQAATGLKRYAEAEALLLGAYQELSSRNDKIPARNRHYIGEAAQALVDLYEAWGKEEQAAPWRKKLEAHKKESGIRNEEVEK